MNDPISSNPALDPMLLSRVMLVDDEPLNIKIARKYLQIAGYSNFIATTDAPAALGMIKREEPDVIVLDIGMPRLNGLEAGRQINQRFPEIKLVFLTVNEDADLMTEAFRAGASAYLLKRSAASELWSAIREVTHNRSYVTPLVTKDLIASLLDVQDRRPAHKLTSRQLEILHLIAEALIGEVGADRLQTFRVEQFLKLRRLQLVGPGEFDILNAEIADPVECRGDILGELITQTVEL